MQKTLALAGLLAAFAAAPAHADLIKVAVNGGYSTVDMKDLNVVMEKSKAASVAAGNTVSYMPFGGGFFVAGEAGLSLLPLTEVGPRIEYLQASPLEYNVSSGASTSKTNISTNLTSFMLGATTGLDLPLTGLGFQVAGYAGHGYAVVNQSTESGGVKNGNQYTAQGFVGELQAKLKYSLMPLLSFDLLGGMRFAALGVLDNGGKPTSTVVDYSGINAGAGLTLGF